MLGQGFPHCRKFPTAASRRSLGRVSVPVWPSALSGRLRIVALVGRCPANQLMRHRSIPPLSPKGHLAQGRCLPCGYAVLADVSVCCPPRRGRLPMYSSPVRHWNPKIPVRLACIRHAASVHPEPGSNSPLNFPQCFTTVSFLFSRIFRRNCLVCCYFCCFSIVKVLSLCYPLFVGNDS